MEPQVERMITGKPRLNHSYLNSTGCQGKGEKTMPRDHETEPCHSKHARHSRGPSSYWMHDPDVVFNQLALKLGDWFLDLGSGPGDYSLRAAKLVGEKGRVFALDKWEQAFQQASERAREMGYAQIKPVLTDLNQALPLNDRSIDLCLMSTVLHSFARPKFGHKVFAEIKRVLKPQGRLAIIECKKEDQSWGPPKHMRISPEEMCQGLKPVGFKKTAYTDLGKTYMLQFEIDLGQAGPTREKP
jgi:ubiquinone/menaquinone biosynthesis C-methylase UbiE